MEKLIWSWKWLTGAEGRFPRITLREFLWHARLLWRRK